MLRLLNHSVCLTYLPERKHPQQCRECRIRTFFVSRSKIPLKCIDVDFSLRLLRKEKIRTVCLFNPNRIWGGAIWAMRRKS